MSEYIETRTVVQDPPAGGRPVVESRIDSVVAERRGMSALAIAALVVASITVVVVITMLILNGQQKTSDDQLAQERARTAAAQQATPQQATPQPAQQPPIIVTVPSSQPSPVVTPVQPPPSYRDSAPSSAALEIDVTSLLQNDPELRTYAIDVKVADGTAILTGYVSDEALKTRAGRLAGTVHGVKRVINNIAVRP